MGKKDSYERAADRGARLIDKYGAKPIRLGRKGSQAMRSIAAAIVRDGLEQDSEEKVLAAICMALSAAYRLGAEAVEPSEPLLPPFRPRITAFDAAVAVCCN